MCGGVGGRCGRGGWLSVVWDRCVEDAGVWCKLLALGWVGVGVVVVNCIVIVLRDAESSGI